MRKLLFILILLLYLWACSSAQPTHFASVSNVGDNTASSTTPTTITPPGSMVAGDLVVLFSMTRTTGATNAISADGGQTWTSLTAGGTTDNTTRVFWCRYNGTWSADPSVSFSTALSCNVSMHVFRPTASSKLWAVDQAIVNTPYSVPSGPPYLVSITGVTNTQPNNVTFAVFTSTDDNTWVTPTGGYTSAFSGPIYRRNPSGSDQSYTPYYKLAAGTGASGTLTLDQSAAAPDAGSTLIVSFYEYSAASTNRGMPLNMIVQ